MKFSKNWLQDYIVEKLPEDGVIADTLNKKAFEVEEIITLPNDTVFDIKVLPNRAHDALGHHGMAYELCSCFGYTFKKDSRNKILDAIDKHITSPLVAIDDVSACTRFMSIRIDGVTVGESPSWLKERLEAIGQRSINNIVDATNYVQFALNKPMHAYDARSVQGTLRARFAKEGEKLVTLDDKNLSLDTSTLVIADDEKVLGLAGIKGGKWSGIQTDTTSILLESANFESTLIRKTAQKYDIRTDASKRFENGIANSLVIEGLYMTANLIKEICQGTVCSEATDIYPKKDVPFKVGISRNEVNAILGTSYDDETIEKTLQALNFPYEKVIPFEKIKELIPEVVGSPYNRLASTLYDAPNSFSCGSLVNWLLKESGYPTPRVALDMYVYSKHIQKEELVFGDYVFTNTHIERPKESMIFSKVLGKYVPDVPKYTKTLEFLRGTEFKEGIDHVGMYIGEGKILHTGSMTEVAVIEELASSEYFKNTCWYGRMVEDLSIPQYVIRVPSVRLDLRIKEDLAEEIGRIIGYEKLTPVLPKLSSKGILHKRAYYENKIREILVEQGFSEVMTYTFGNVGDVEIVKGLADDKEKLRKNLGAGISQSLALNLYNAPLLGQKTIKIFEFGNVFEKESESRHLVIAIDDGAKKSNFSEEVDMLLAGIKRVLNVKEIEADTVSAKPYVVELDFDTLIKELSEPSSYETFSFSNLPVVTYKSVSPYPFITRDIAMWVPDTVTWEDISTLCNQVRNSLVTRIDLFDTFSKETEGVKKTSYAFRLVFQSYEKTLTDEEVNGMMQPYYEMFKGKGFEIR